MKFSKPSLRPIGWASAYTMTEERRQRLLHSWLRGEVALDPSSGRGMGMAGKQGAERRLLEEEETDANSY